MKNRKTVVFGSGSSISKNLINDVVVANDYEYCDSSKIYNSIFSILISPKFFKMLPFFLKEFIYITFFNYRFLRNINNYCFVFFDTYELCGFDNRSFYQFVDFLKKKFPNSKYGLFFIDPIDPMPYSAMFSEMKRRFDIIYTYNRYDSEKYDIVYYGNLSEHNSFEIEESSIFPDLLYAGMIDDGIHNARLKLILSIFKKVSDYGLSCYFVLASVSQTTVEEIHKYLSSNMNDVIIYKNSKLVINKYVPSLEYLSLLKNSKVILEVVSKDANVSCTARLSQAMAYKKKLLTNCYREREETYYRTNNIQIITNEDEIDFDFFDTPFEEIDYDFSATAMIKKMESELYGKQQ